MGLFLTAMLEPTDISRRTSKQSQTSCRDTEPSLGEGDDPGKPR